MTPFDSSLLLPVLDSPRRAAHLVGARGTGMKAMAELLIGMGWQVTGSDNRVATLPSDPTGYRITQGHHASNVPANADVLVHTPAVDSTNVEVRAAETLGIPCLTYPQMLGEIMLERRGIAVCGTHGKSTTTALLGWILAQGGLSPSVAIGAELTWPRKSGWAGNSDLFVAEACEYRRGFLHLEPEMVVMLGMEADHFDCFGDLADQRQAFTEFTQQVTNCGTVFANVDCRATAAIAADCRRRVTRFSLSGPVGWRAVDVCPVETGLLFRVCHGEHHHSDVLLPLFGRHHVINGLAAIAVASELGMPAERIEEAVESFPGLGRRFEEVGVANGVTVIDDYAHHPTAITATIRAARQKYPRRFLTAVFEPHQYSRTSALFDDFARSLSKADRVVIAPVFTARENVDPVACKDLTDELATAVTKYGGSAEAITSLDRVIATLDDSLEPGDVLLTMGAGNIDRIPHEFIGRFQRHSQAG